MWGVVRGSQRSFRTPIQEFRRNLSCTSQCNAYIYSHKKLQSKAQELKGGVRKRMEADAQPGTDKFSQHNFTTIEAQMGSLQTKGFLRKYLQYYPPDDVQTIFLRVCSTVLGKEVSISDMHKVELTDPNQKYKLLTSLGKEFNHFVHNSRLRDMDSLDKLYLFYTTRVDQKNPYDRLFEDVDLPPNLHIQKDPVRFTGKGDHKYDQVTAFPRSSTIVSGLYTRDKFEAHETELDIYSEQDYE